MWLCRIVDANAFGNDIPFGPNSRRCRGSNPGHPRDRREYSPLYYNDIVMSEVSTVDLIGSTCRISKTCPTVITNARGNSSTYGWQYEVVQSDETTVICPLPRTRPNVRSKGSKELSRATNKKLGMWLCGIVCKNALVNYIAFAPPFAPLPWIESGSPA